MFILPTIIAACHKSNGTDDSPASINIINAIPDGNSIVPVFGNELVRYFSSAQTISYGGFALYSPLSGSGNLSITQISDTNRNLFNGKLQFAPGGIYSFFLTGDTLKPDTLFVKDQLVNYADSSVGVRFVNLSPDSKALTINLIGNDASQTEFEPMGYKGISSFKKYTADINVPGFYSFEIRDQASGDVLTTFDWYYTLHKNNTIVIAGSVDPASSTPLNLFQINYF